jgi:hypothetical protein
MQSTVNGLFFLAVGLYLTWWSFRPVPKRIAENPEKLQRYKRYSEIFRWTGPGLAITSALYILAKLTI